MVDHKLKNLRGIQRRRFLRWAGAAAAAIGVSRAGLLNFLDEEGGEALAQDGSCAITNRSVHIVGGGGSFSWFTLLWPHLEIAQSGDNTICWHAPGEGVLHTAGDRDFYYGPEAPWTDASGVPIPGREVSAFMAGSNETHTRTPVTAATVAGNAGMIATAASIQRADPTLLPVIGVEPVNLGSAPGAPSIAKVPNAGGMVELFNSSASQLTLAAAEDKEMYETYYKAIVGLRKAANKPTWQRHLQITKTAANLLGRNLAAQLAPTQQDIDDYGITTLLASQASAAAMSNLENVARALITSARAFKLGLSKSVVIAFASGPADNQFVDPHAAWNNVPRIRDTVIAIGTMLDAFYADLASSDDPSCSGQTLDQSTVMTFHGDTPKTPLQRSAWPDGTPQNSNWLYVMGGGHLRNGWHGQLKLNGDVDGFDPATGSTVTGQSAAVTSTAAGAAAAYAVAKGDIKVVEEYYSGPSIEGIIV